MHHTAQNVHELFKELNKMAKRPDPDFKPTTRESC